DYSIKKYKRNLQHKHRLMNYLFDEFGKDPKELAKSLTEYVDHIPELLCSKFEQPTRDNIKRLTRF
ncbi:hypothetical protein BgiBS90_020843, partial [Biomphalaria glabrata]